MATLYVTELTGVGFTGPNGVSNVLVEPAPPNALQLIAIGSSSVASAAFGQGTQVVQLFTDTACSFTFGTSPNASAATSSRLAANTTRYFSVPPNASYKVAVIA